MDKRFAIALLVACLAATFSAAQVKLDPEARYLLLATTKTSTMQKELDEVSAEGFRVVVGSPTSAAEMAILMERLATPPNTYKYKLLATSFTGTMQKELNQFAAEGYRLLPRTMIAKEQLFGSHEIVVLLEKEPNSTKKYDYKLLATTRTATLQREITEAQRAGYVIAGMVSRDEHMVIMEKEAKQ